MKSYTVGHRRSESSTAKLEIRCGASWLTDITVRLPSRFWASHATELSRRTADHGAAIPWSMNTPGIGASGKLVAPESYQPSLVTDPNSHISRWFTISARMLSEAMDRF